MGRIETITRFLKGYDSQLYVERREGKLCVLRKSSRVESYELNGTIIHFIRPTPYFVMAITTDWKMHSPDCDWGIEPIMKRIKEIDLWKRDLAGEIIQQTEKDHEIAEKDLRNNNEAFLKDWRGQFKKATADVNTSTLAKTDKRRTGENAGYC